MLLSMVTASNVTKTISIHSQTMLTNLINKTELPYVAHNNLISVHCLHVWWGIGIP